MKKDYLILAAAVMLLFGISGCQQSSDAAAWRASSQAAEETKRDSGQETVSSIIMKEETRAETKSRSQAPHGSSGGFVEETNNFLAESEETEPELETEPQTEPQTETQPSTEASESESSSPETESQETVESTNPIEESTSSLPDILAGTAVSYQPGDRELTGPMLSEPKVVIPEGYLSVRWFQDEMHTIEIQFPYVLTDQSRKEGIRLYPLYVK